MAIYKNREVYLVSTYVPSNTNVDLVAVSYTNGMRDNVPLNQVAFTDEEKKALVKDNPSRFESVKIASKEDVEAIRVGVTPPSDPVYKQEAEAKVQAEAQRKKLADLQKQAEDNAKKAQKWPKPSTSLRSSSLSVSSSQGQLLFG